MILTLISPTGERWSSPLSEFSAESLRHLENEEIQRAQEALTPILKGPLPPKGLAVLSHKTTGWQAILSNP